MRGRGTAWRIVRTGVVCTVVAVSLLFSESPRAQSFTTEKHAIAIDVVAEGLDTPWGLAFMPGGRALITERDGQLRLLDLSADEGKRLSDPLEGVPKVAATGQGGLLDVAISPDFATSRLVFLSFAETRGSGGKNGTSVARARLSDDSAGLEAAKIIFRQEPAFPSKAHFGSRLVFDRTGALFVTVGDRYSLRDEAQNPANHIGKILRILPDGGIPEDNPKPAGWAPEVWSIGHRNVQGAALHPESGALFTAEHGARGGDEVNTPKAGRNYGWPVITYGRDYSGAKIGVGTKKDGMEQPIHYWDPSIAPAGMAFYTGDLFPAWKGNLFVGALAGQRLARLEVTDGKVVHEEMMLTELEVRIRDVQEGPDGNLFLLDETNGRVLRLKPAN